ncbi:MAG TPA: sigma-E factor negative regulatory protein [Burkholderiaceae bacterium]
MTSANESSSLERLSALMDGEARADEVRGACAAWRDDAAQRERWHAWQLIGDVLRSDDLAAAPLRDAALLARLRSRLEAEPALLAPTEPAPRVARWSALGVPAAVAAGFLVVGAAVLVLRPPAPRPAEMASAAAPQPVALAASVDTAEALAEVPVTFVSGQMVRDARLEQYLAAHKQFGGSAALGVPSGFLRSATVEVPLR